MICPKCGANILNGASFCGECGSKLEIPKNHFCGECGAKLSGNVKFCPECGAKIIPLQEAVATELNTNPVSTGNNAAANWAAAGAAVLGGLAGSMQDLSLKASGRFQNLANKATDRIQNAANIASERMQNIPTRNYVASSSPVNQTNNPNTSKSASMSSQAQYNVNSTARQQSSCPHCGAPLNSFSAKCPHCGYEIIFDTSASACRELVNRLDQIEASRPQKNLLTLVTGIVNKAIDKRAVLDETDQKKMELISSFIISNTKLELLDFITLANSRINACEKLLKTCNDDEYTTLAQTQFEEIWQVKLNEALDRAELVLRSDCDYIAIKEQILSDQTKRYISHGRCAFCGGSFKGLFNKVCSSCGKQKSY